jgi:hypothetical protein
MTEKTILNLEVAERIRKSILEFQEYFEPAIFESAIIVGGIKNRGYSNHDIDIVLTWDCLPVNDDKTFEHLLSWLKERHGEIINQLHLISYVKHETLCFKGCLV